MKISREQWANIVTAFHFLVLIVGLASLPVAMLLPSTRPVILALVVLVVLSWIPYIDCALTVWEKRLRQDEKYVHDFLTYYTRKLLGLNFTHYSAYILTFAYMGTIIVVCIT